MAVIVVIMTVIIQYCCSCQLVLSVVVHAMKRQSCILNEDVQKNAALRWERKTPLGHCGDVNYV